jgi:hypothetical protein
VVLTLPPLAVLVLERAEEEGAAEADVDRRARRIST